MKKILITIYIHPEFYPPTLNAINEFSKVFDKVTVVTRNLAKTNWDFPRNVTLKASGNYISLEDSMRQSWLKKVQSFFHYLLLLYRNLKYEKPDLVVVYDPIALFSYWLLKTTLFKKHLLWYHNHDVIEKEILRKFSIGWLAALFESKIFPNINIFSLPSEERKKYFPMNRFNGQYFFIPNLPSGKFYSQFQHIGKEKTCIKILFQGTIGPGHGIEELMDLLPFQINEKSIRLVLKGFLKEPFKTELYKIVNERSIGDNIEIHGITSYRDVPKITTSCHIGIAIFTKRDIMNQTLGTASNKIYEYAACGLPVLYYDDEHFRKHLSKYKWAVPTDITKKSLINSIEFIDSNYTELSNAARSDFENELNFENNFRKIIIAIKNKLQ